MKSRYIVRMLLALFVANTLTVTFHTVSATSTAYWTFEILDPFKVAYPGDTVVFWVRVTNLPESDEPLSIDWVGVWFYPPLSPTYASFDFLAPYETIPVGETRELPFASFEWTHDVPVGYVQGGWMEAGANEGDPQSHPGNYSVTIIPPTAVSVDIRPGSWPNPIKTRSRGVLPVAICGTADLDVTTIDPTSVRLHSEDVEAGVSPLRWSWEDVATPYTADWDGGHDLEGDGFMDLVLHFDMQEAVMTLTVTDHLGETLPLILRGHLFEEYDGTPILGQDYVRIR